MTRTYWVLLFLLLSTEVFGQIGIDARNRRQECLRYCANNGRSDADSVVACMRTCESNGDAYQSEKEFYERNLGNNNQIKPPSDDEFDSSTLVNSSNGVVGADGGGASRTPPASAEPARQAGDGRGAQSMSEWVAHCEALGKDTKEECQQTYCTSHNPGSSECSNYQANKDNNLDQNQPNQQELCMEAIRQIANDCNPESKSWMQDITSVTSTLNQANSAMGASACSQLSAVDAASQAALATFSMTCNSSYNECKTACAKTISSNISISQCDFHGKRGKDAEARATQAMQKVASSIQQCQAAFGGETDPCANPANVGTIACKGVQPIQGGTTIAVTGSGLQNTTPTGMSHGGTGGGTGGEVGSVEGYGIDDDGVVGSDYVAKPVEQGEEIGGAKGGGNVAASSGSGGGAGGAGGGDGENQGLGSKILSGFFGGGGGGGGSGGRGSGGWRGFFGLGGKEQKVQARGPDLKQFMPGGRMDPKKHRGIAGQFVGKDGISGPHANLWKLVNNRYQYKRPTLLP